MLEPPAAPGKIGHLEVRNGAAERQALRPSVFWLASPRLGWGNLLAVNAVVGLERLPGLRLDERMTQEWLAECVVILTSSFDVVDARIEPRLVGKLLL